MKDGKTEGYKHGDFVSESLLLFSLMSWKEQVAKKEILFPPEALYAIKTNQTSSRLHQTQHEPLLRVQNKQTAFSDFNKHRKHGLLQ